MVCRAVIFDLFGTLVPPFSAAPYERALAEMVAAVGLDPVAFRRMWLYGTADGRMTGAFASIEAEIAHIARALGADPTPAQLTAAARVRLDFYRAALNPRPDAVATLRALKGLGLRLGLVSDCSCEAPALWPSTPFAALIDGPVFSCVAGVRKPAPRLYRLACERLGVAPGECAYVADGYHGELATAQALGMHAVLIAVPGEATGEFTPDEAAGWAGARVAALSELVELLAGAERQEI